MQDAEKMLPDGDSVSNGRRQQAAYLNTLTWHPLTYSDFQPTEELLARCSGTPKLSPRRLIPSPS